jgi:hypothetical protein
MAALPEKLKPFLTGKYTGSGADGLDDWKALDRIVVHGSR